MIICCCGGTCAINELTARKTRHGFVSLTGTGGGRWLVSNVEFYFWQAGSPPTQLDIEFGYSINRYNGRPESISFGTNPDLGIRGQIATALGYLHPPIKDSPSGTYNDTSLIEVWDYAEDRIYYRAERYDAFGDPSTIVDYTITLENRYSDTMLEDDSRDLMFNTLIPSLLGQPAAFGLAGVRDNGRVFIDWNNFILSGSSSQIPYVGPAPNVSRFWDNASAANAPAPARVVIQEPLYSNNNCDRINSGIDLNSTAADQGLARNIMFDTDQQLYATRIKNFVSLCRFTRTRLSLDNVVVSSTDTECNQVVAPTLDLIPDRADLFNDTRLRGVLIVIKGMSRNPAGNYFIPTSSGGTCNCIANPAP